MTEGNLEMIVIPCMTCSRIDKKEQTHTKISESSYRCQNCGQVVNFGEIDIPTYKELARRVLKIKKYDSV
jgi:uncharacterized Zn finger protein